MASTKDMCWALDEIWKLVGPGDRDWHNPSEVLSAVVSKLGGEIKSLNDYEQRYFPAIAEHKRNGGPHEWHWELRCKVCGVGYFETPEAKR